MTFDPIFTLVFLAFFSIPAMLGGIAYDLYEDRQVWISENFPMESVSENAPVVLYSFYTWIERNDGTWLVAITNIRGDDLPGTCGYANETVPIIEIEDQCMVIRLISEGRCQSTYWHEIVHLQIPGTDEDAEHMWMQRNVLCH